MKRITDFLCPSSYPSYPSGPVRPSALHSDAFLKFHAGETKYTLLHIRSYGVGENLGTSFLED